jgi:(2Fe-2S) ferredoxin
VAELKFIADVDELRALAPVTAAPIRHHVFVCAGKSCSANDSAEVKAAFERELTARGLLMGKAAKGKNPQGSIVLTDCASVGFCAIGAAVLVYPDGVWYAQVRAADVPEIIESHLLNDRVVERLALMKVPAEGSAEPPTSREDGDWEV